MAQAVPSTITRYESGGFYFSIDTKLHPPALCPSPVTSLLFLWVHVCVPSKHPILHWSPEPIPHIYSRPVSSNSLLWAYIIHFCLQI